MFEMRSTPVLIDPGLPPPRVFIRTGGLVVEHHEILLPAHNGAPRWEQRGTNVPEDDNDSGTPDIYTIPNHSSQDGNLLEVFVDLFNVTESEKRFHLEVQIWQGDYEPDILIDERDVIPAKETQSFGVFTFLESM